MNFHSCIHLVTYLDIFREYHFQWGILGQEPKKQEFWRIISSYKSAWVARVEIVYSGKCNYYVLINCIRHSVRWEFIQSYFKILTFYKEFWIPYRLTSSKTLQDIRPYVATESALNLSTLYLLFQVVKLCACGIVICQSFGDLHLQ